MFKTQKGPRKKFKKVPVNVESGTLVLYTMDLAAGAVGGGTFATILVIAAAIYKCINHKECRSACCGRVATASLDINSTPLADSPPRKSIVLKRTHKESQLKDIVEPREPVIDIEAGF